MKAPRNKRFIIGSLIIGAALVALVASGMRSSALRAVPVTELRAADSMQHSFVGQRVRVVGYIGHEPVRKTPLRTASGLINITHFSVCDEKGGRLLAVEYRDALPDAFRPGGTVQVDGVYAAPGTMRAERVLTKCPSKYEEVKPAKGVRKETYKAQM